MGRSKTPPRWLTFLFPQLTGLESNPLYLRLSGRAYTRRRGMFSRPAEFALGKSSTLGAIGCLPVLFLAIPVLLPLAAMIALARLLGGGTTGCVNRFVRNGARESWGSELWLTGLSAAEIDKAIFAAAMERGAPWILAGVAIGGSGSAAALSHFTGKSIWIPIAAWNPWFAVILAIGVAVALVYGGIVLLAIGLANAIDDAPIAAKSWTGTNLFSDLSLPLVLGLVQAFASFIFVAFAGLLGAASTRAGEVALILSPWFSVVLSTGFGLDMARELLTNGLGKAATAMRDLAQTEQKPPR